MEDNVKRFLDFLGAAEGADYGTIVGGKQKITDFSAHPNVVGLRTAEGPSTAAGKYQITNTTYKDFAPKLGITDFSPESQDRIALAIIEREGALDAVKAGDWNTAINKLGGRWASLPSSPYKQPKRDATFVAKHLGTSVESSPMQYGMTSPGSIAPTQGPSQAGLELTEAKRDSEYGGVINQIEALPTAFQSGFQNENGVYNFFKDQGLSSRDPNFSWTEERAVQALEGIPRENRDYILQSGSWDEVMLRRGRLMEAMKRQQELSQMGFVGTAGTITGSLLDLPTLVGFVPFIGGMALVSRTSRVANAVASGVASAASNVAVDAAMMKYRPLGHTDELYFSAVAGLGFGALGGSLVNPAKVGLNAARRAATKDIASAIEQGAEAHALKPITFQDEMEALRRFGRREANIIQRRELEDAGLELTINGKRILDDPNFGRGNVEIDAIRSEKQGIPTFDREVRADRTPAVAQGEEVPRFPSGRERPAVSAKSILGTLSNSTQDPMVGPLATRLLDQLVDDVNIYFVPKKDLIGGGRSFYDTSRHALFIRSDAPDRIKLHEIAHAATVQKLIYGAANPDTLHGHLTAQLVESFNEAKAAAKGKGLDREAQYYLKDIYEFTAGLYSGKTQFIDFLASVKTSGDTLLGKAVNIVRKLLGMDDNETNLLLKSLDLTDKLIDSRLNVNIRRPGRAGEGPAVSVHMEPVDGLDVDPALAAAVNHAGLNEVFGWSFGLEHKLRKLKELPGAAALADKLIGTTVGYKGHGVVQRNAYDQSLQLSDGWITSVKKVAYTEFEDYMKRSGRKIWERGDVAREWNEQLGNYVRGFQGQYDKSVIATGDEIRRALVDAVDHINNPAKATGGTKRGLTQEVVKDDLGNETLTAPLPYNPNYLPRSHDLHKWQQMVDQFGRKFVEQFWASAFKSANLNVSSKVAMRFGKWYVKRIEAAKVNRDGDFLTEQLRGYDKEGLKDSMVRSGMSDADAQELLNDMFPLDSKGSKSTVSNTKQRSVINESFSLDVWVGGEKTTVTMNNFINTDTLHVLEGYFKRMGGAISLANHADIYKQTDIGKVIMDATHVDFGNPVKTPHLEKLRKDFQFTIDRILHRPVEEFTPLNKGMEMWRNFNVIRLMGAAVYNQIQELSQIVGTMGWKTTLQAIPQLGSWRRDLLSGKVVNPMLDDLENIVGGAGSDLILRADFNPSDDWVRELGNTKFNQWLDRADNGLRKFAMGTLKYTGMTGVMVQQKRIHAIAFVNHFFDVATKGKALGFTPERLAWMGFDATDVAKIKQGMSNHATTKTGVTGKKVGTVDFEAWRSQDPDTFSKFVTAFQRESRRVVQENDLTSQIPIMGEGWAKTTFQFLNFVMQAWNKSMLYGMHHRDFATLSTVMHGSFFAGLTYMARTQAQMVGLSEDERADFAKKRLSTKQIVANSFGRIAQASLLPNVIDQVSPVPIFSGVRTTSDTTDFLSSNPTMSSISAMFSLWRKSVRNGLSDNYQFTERDAHSFMRLLPLNNVVGISGVLRSLASDLPKREQLEPDE